MSDTTWAWPKEYAYFLLALNSGSVLFACHVVVGLVRAIRQRKHKFQQIPAIYPYLLLYIILLVVYHVVIVANGAIVVANSAGIDKFSFYDESFTLISRETSKWFGLLHLALSEAIYTGAFATSLVGCMYLFLIAAV